VRKQWIFGLVAVAVVLAAGGVAAALFATAGNPRSSARTSALAVKLSSAQQARLERGLAAPSITAEAAVLAVELRAQFLEKGQSLLPGGSQARIAAATFKTSSPRTATVDASITGPQPRRWQLLLIKENGSWLLIGTRELR
jgi:hypothetical protein